MTDQRGRHVARSGPARTQSAHADDGQEAVGQALLITAVSIGALSASQLSRIVISACQTLITALS